MTWSRRTFLHTSLPLLASAPIARPNIVLFLSDDHGYLDSSVYGAKDVRTPAMASMAAAGMTFTHAFAASPTCVPSRSAIATGLLPARNGAERNHSGVAPGITTLPTFLKAAGYRVAHFGKSHFQPRESFLDWESMPSEIRRGPLDHDLDTAALRAWLERPRDPGTPVCLVVCSHSPHVYWRANEGYDPATLDLPPTFVDTPETREARARYYSDISFADRQLGETRDLAARHLGNNTLFLYTTDNGAQWPFAKWSLYDAGIRLPFIAAWPGVIRPGTRTSAMISLCDLLPTFLDLAGAPAPRDLDGRSFASILRGNTASHRSEITASHSGDGDWNVYPMRCLRSPNFKYILNLHPEFKYTTHIDRAGPADGRAYFDTWVARAQSDPAAAAIVRRYHIHPREELYALASDPHEMRNLAAAPAHTAMLRRMRTRLEAVMREQRDEGKVFGTPRLWRDEAKQ